MKDRERISLTLVADHAWKVKYDDLWRVQSRASNALLRAKNMSDLGKPTLIAQCERELKAANLRLRAWIL